jgi:hypothetical protein
VSDYLAVAPVLASRSRKAKMREEMLAHVTSVFDDEFARSNDEPAALAKTVERFGDPAELTRQLQASITMVGYVAWFLGEAWLLRGEALRVNHDRFYNVLLIILSLYIVGGLALAGWLLGIPPESRPDMQWPDWSMQFFTALNVFYLLAMMLTLVLRFAWPGAGKRMTKVLNVLFLLGPPMGTALGVYGLFWVDRELKPGVSS